MKTLKATLMGAAIVLAIGSAIASSVPDCSKQAQFYRASNGVYYPAGQQGYDYVCSFQGEICTYYFDAARDQYRPCKSGKLLWLR